MSRVRAFFLEEAAQCLAVLARANEAGNTASAYGAVRRLRGSAQLARYAQVAELAIPLEHRLRDIVRGLGSWTLASAHEVARGIDALERSVQAVRDGTIQQQVGRNMVDEQRLEGGPVEVAIRELEYSGSAALSRALEIRGPLEEAMAAGDPVDGILDELFDLIGLGLEG